ncbi:MAG TPA: penicillin acylase family protein, partial [Terriglobales bacterium]|nr:penicillin acylase family protein [Terriglobales bacterium]
MATTTVDISAPSKNWRVRSVLIVFVLLLLLCFGLGGWLYSIARSALPQLDGTVSISGLTAKATVTRDAHGAPTIEAGSLEDLFLAQGYVTAQDRLWPMDVMRRFAAGEISEILGPAF